MIVKKIVFHHIVKELKDKPILKCSDRLLPVNDTVIEFVVKLIKNYSSKNPTQGTFKEDKANYPFQSKVDDYIKDDDFLKFTQESMKILEKEINKSTTTGGYVVFVHYEEKKVDFLITAMLDKSAQFTVDDKNLDIAKLMTLDVEKLARANRLNFNKWQALDVLYLSFIKGTRDVSKYFIDFIGSTDITSAKENFIKLSDATNKYFVDNNLSILEKDKIKDNISNYIVDCFEKGKDVELISISSIINAQEPNSFLDFISDKELEVSGKISINKRADYDTFFRNRVSEKGYTLVFDKSLVKTKKIEHIGNQIIINDVPAEYIKNFFEDDEPAS
jgi:nucleoid-associated protein